MRKLWSQHPFALTGFLLAAAVALFFAGHLVVRTIYWMDPDHRNMVPQPWMTVGFIGKSWGLDPRLIDEKAGLPSPGEGRGGPRTLQDIARERGVPVAQVIVEVEAVILTLKAAEPAE